MCESVPNPTRKKLDLARERHEFAAAPELESEELARIYIDRGLEIDLARQVARRLLRDVMKLNLKTANSRLFGPDETASNRLEAVYDVSGKAWMAEVEPVDIDLSADGQVMEVLSEHLCEGWLEGYLLI